jgi:hypothetical protein
MRALADGCARHHRVDPNIQSLNRFTENISKAEALGAEIDSILQSSNVSRKSLITFVLPPAVSLLQLHAPKWYVNYGG